MLVCRTRFTWQDTIDLCISLSEDGWSLEQFHKNERKQSRRRLMPGNQERQNLKTDVEVV